MSMQNQSVEDSIDSVIDVLNTQAFAEDEVDDTREHTYTSNFSCHGRSRFQRDCNFTDCHPFSPVDLFDYNAAPASTIVFETSIPEAPYRLPCC